MENFTEEAQTKTMATYGVDAKGKRIDTDILVAGYIRDCNKDYKLLIPEDINAICFVFWFIKVSDEWDRQYLAKNVEINGQIVHTETSQMVSIYGSLGVDKGIHSWKLRLTSDVQWMNIGFIEDNSDILKKHQTSNQYLYDKSGGCLSTDGKLYANIMSSTGTWFPPKSYIPIPFRTLNVLKTAGTRITLTLDRENNTISYGIIWLYFS